MAAFRCTDAGGPRLETAVKNCLKLVPVLAVAKIDEINQLDSCAVPQLKVLTIKFPLRQKRFDSYWSINRPAAAFEQEQLTRKQDRSGISSLGRASACQDSFDMGKAMSIRQLMNQGMRTEEATLVLIL